MLDIVVDDDGATLTGGRRRSARAARAHALASAMGLTAADVRACRRTWPAAGCPSPTWPCSRARSTTPPPTTPPSTGSASAKASRCSPGTPPPSTAYARVFAGDLQWDEDPATGSAALGPGVWLVATGLLSDEGTSSYVVRQGEKMGRPSVLSCTVTAAGGTAVSATVQGAVVPIAAGRIRVPI